MVANSVDRAKVIFGNEIDTADYEKACKGKEKYARRFGDDSNTVYHLRAEEAPVIGKHLGVRWLRPAEPGSDEVFDMAADAAAAPVVSTTPKTISEVQGKPLVVGNIRMGFGHYRISMAIASAAHALGFVPYWFDLCGFPESTCSKLIEHQNNLYSMGSRVSQKVGAFNALYWEPLNSEGFRKLTYNSGDQKNAELMVPIFRDLPKDVPYVGTHAWPAQAAVHAGMTHVVNAIPDNWPMALHLAEGSRHAVQTPSAYQGYKMLRGMDKKRQLKPMPEGSLFYTGHYIDHELVSNIEADCAARRARLHGGCPIRYLVCVGGAGAQQDLIRGIIEHAVPLAERGEATLLVNVGDHIDVWDALAKSVPALSRAKTHFDDFTELENLVSEPGAPKLDGIHAFGYTDIFAAVYSTNLLMRHTDVLVTKPSELAFYPVPKLMIHRVGGHEAWGAIRAAEIGDGTYELQKLDEITAMMDAFQQDRSLVSMMCDRIEEANAHGVYNGAYRAVLLAAGLWPGE
ncbi:Uncharacterised protein [Slackia heliotrinireducens]|uniref:Uncharacterized protein n=1 Tax=Slackia heliotrinireducens (strain ATCC 29202 / DSM 20476 / NCTC 11029 / RHS 1) TaxID=471855 RepID=C7N3W8_SLAHD|nr:hypothetical protein [Slackia heliotrinireducens]ACV21709.1 hypothetical protein Shel_06500 [Slackia heliotrinireducens DSM 20476]VEG99348.1 Uncharacterised protein [Slackia heliotrinireducens]